MHCFLCFFSLVFLFSMIYMTLFKNDALLDSFQRNLNVSLKQKYASIIKERRTIYYTGFTIGVCISMVIIMFVKMTAIYRVCASVLITMITTYFVYMLYPKSDYMILHLNDAASRKRWLEVYKSMQFHNHMGFLFGIIFVMLLSYGLL